MKLHKKVLLVSIAFLIFVVPFYSSRSNNLNKMLGFDQPNLTINIKNTNLDIAKLRITYNNDLEIIKSINGKENEIVEMAYRSNSGDKLYIELIDHYGDVVSDLKPNLKITPQHLYRPNIKYNLEISIEDEVLEFTQNK